MSTTTHASIIHSLLSNPPGTYGLTPYGRTHAVSLTGSEEFRRLAFNLFANLGDEQRRGAPILRTSDRPDTVWFCLPATRAEAALRLYFHTQLVRANLRGMFDEEGDFVESVCDIEAALWAEAEQLAIDFIVNHMPKDYGAIPINEWDSREVMQHGFGSLGVAHTSE